MGRRLAMTAVGLATLAAMLSGGTAHAHYTDGMIKIGVLDGMSGLYADLAGPGSAAGEAFRPLKDGGCPLVSG